MKIDIDKFTEYLALFGLGDDYTADELASSYRTLAKLNHPDIIKNAESDERMSLINGAHDFLKDVLATGQIKNLKIEKPGGKREDIFYSQYKKGFLILKNAFEDYFGDGEKKNNFRDEKILREKLLLAKIEFSRLVNEFPYNEWVNDAIDKISSINKWLD